MIKLTIAFLCLTTCLFSVNTYENCQSIEEVISKETQALAGIHPARRDKLATALISRGESYILNGQNEKAIEEFGKALEHAEYFNDLELKWVITFRALFGKIISYDQLAMQEEAENALEQLKNVVDCFVCDDYYGSIQPALNIINSFDNFSIIPISVDPNEPQPSWWCEATVKNTTAVLMGIIVNIRTSSVRFAAAELIKKLEIKAINCCYAGGLWSACIKPLADKFLQWNQKWKAFGIPPDPSWDSDLK